MRLSSLSFNRCTAETCWNTMDGWNLGPFEGSLSRRMPSTCWKIRATKLIPAQVAEYLGESGPWDWQHFFIKRSDHNLHQLWFWTTSSFGSHQSTIPWKKTILPSRIHPSIASVEILWPWLMKRSWPKFMRVTWAPGDCHPKMAVFCCFLFIKI